MIGEDVILLLHEQHIEQISTGPVDRHLQGQVIRVSSSPSTANIRAAAACFAWHACEDLPFCNIPEDSTIVTDMQGEKHIIHLFAPDCPNRHLQNNVQSPPLLNPASTSQVLGRRERQLHLEVGL